MNIIEGTYYLIRRSNLTDEMIKSLKKRRARVNFTDSKCGYCLRLSMHSGWINQHQSKYILLNALLYNECFCDIITKTKIKTKTKTKTKTKSKNIDKELLVKDKVDEVVELLEENKEEEVVENEHEDEDEVVVVEEVEVEVENGEVEDKVEDKVEEDKVEEDKVGK